MENMIALIGIVASVLVATGIATVGILLKIERNVSALATWRDAQEKQCEERMEHQQQEIDRIRKWVNQLHNE